MMIIHITRWDWIESRGSLCRAGIPVVTHQGGNVGTSIAEELRAAAEKIIERHG